MQQDSSRKQLPCQTLIKHKNFNNLFNQTLIFLKLGEGGYLSCTRLTSILTLPDYRMVLNPPVIGFMKKWWCTDLQNFQRSKGPTDVKCSHILHVSSFPQNNCFPLHQMFMRRENQSCMCSASYLSIEVLLASGFVLPLASPSVLYYHNLLVYNLH